MRQRLTYNGGGKSEGVRDQDWKILCRDIYESNGLKRSKNKKEDEKKMSSDGRWVRSRANTEWPVQEHSPWSLGPWMQTLPYLQKSCHVAAAAFVDRTIYTSNFFFQKSKNYPPIREDNEVAELPC